MTLPGVGVLLGQGVCVGSGVHVGGGEVLVGGGEPIVGMATVGTAVGSDLPQATTIKEC